MHCSGLGLDGRGISQHSLLLLVRRRFFRAGVDGEPVPVALDGERVVLSELREKTFIAELHLRRDGRALVVSSRSSDAIAIACRTGTPIFAADEVIEEVGFMEGDEADDEPEEVVEEFKDFLDTISPEDFAD